MANLYYAVFQTAGAVAEGPVLNEATFTFTGTAGVSTDVVDPSGENRSRRVRVFADADAFVTWGADPTAATDGTDGRPIGAENPEYFWMLANEKLSAITRT